MKVFLDDCRETPPGWVRTYTAPQTIALLETGLVDELSLDHDLGELDGTGYDVCLWLEEAVYGGFVPPKKIYIHSANPVGRAKMKVAIERVMEMAR